MNQKIIILPFLLIFNCINKHTTAQSPGDAFKKMASVPLQSPQAASLSKYVEFPVSYYNGLAQISFPIYEVVTGDISVPISLSYHGGGIKVQEEASWVGLGWTLNAGGVITHEIKGGNDEVGIYNQFNKVYPNGMGNTYLENSYTTGVTNINFNSVYNNSGISYDPLNLYNQLSGGIADTEPDMYVYNFGSYSGKFSSGDGQYVDLSHNNILFQKSGTGFSALTPDGYTYTFECIEKAWSYPTPNATNTAYYLTKIKSPKGKLVTFQYKSFKTMINEHESDVVKWSTQYSNLNYAWGNDETVMQLPALTEHYLNFLIYTTTSPSVDPPSSERLGLHQSYSSTTASNFYLDKIYFDNGFIDFVKSPRNDLYGVKLDEIKIFLSNGTLVKSVPFTYSYFQSNTGDDDMYDRINKVKYLDTYDARVDYYPATYRNTRLKLLNVTIEASPHSFQYHEGDQYNTLPFKTSFKQDFWGYYNGRSNNTLVPDYDLYTQQMSLPTQLSACDGANREPNDSYIRAGLLKRINYPTGGYSDFNYEMNEFDNLSLQQQTAYREVKYGGVDAGAGLKKFYFTITEETNCNIFGGLYCNGMQDMNSASYNCGCSPQCGGSIENGLYAYVEKVDPNTHATIAHYLNWDFDISKQDIKNAGGYINRPNETFAPGTYSITINYPDSHTPPGDIPNNRRAELYVAFYEPVPGQVNTTSIGAGLRISRIKHIDPVTTQVLERNFTYTGGKMMRYPIFCSRTLMDYSDQYNLPWGGTVLLHTDYLYYYLYATPSMPCSFSANGSHGGYDFVTETISGPSSIGKTVYEYKNRPDKMNLDYAIYLPGVPTTGYLDNGFLKWTGVYDKNNALLKETLNESVIGIAKTYWPFKGRYSTNENNPATFASRYQFSFYPVQVGKLLTTKTTVNDYASGNTMTTAKDFTYNENGLLSQESNTSSDGSNLTSNYSYASDYTGVSSGWIKDLKDKNMIGIPLEVYNKKNDLVTAGSFTTYLNHDNIITPEKVYKIETASPKTIASTVPNAAIPADLKPSGTLTYDANGNLIQSRAENDVYTSYLWGYNKAYPVAQVTGADFAAINALITNGTVSQSVLSNPFSTDAVVNQQLTNLRNGLAATKALVNTYTYKPLIGISSQTDAKGLSTYYNYDSYNRLATIRDQQNNILKSYSYYYSPTLKNIANSLFYNQAITKSFGKQCSPDAFGRTQISTDVPYTIPAEKYVGYNQVEANLKAEAELNVSGQANANILGNCYIYAGPLDLIAVENGLGNNVSINYKCPFNVDYFYLFIQDVATGLLINGGYPFQMFNSQTRFNTTITKGKDYKFWLEAGGQSYPTPLISQIITKVLP
ncbi:MAG: DUF5977 domain-containing protein [Ginsengibacter sp.]